jgi:phage tail sheath gpL-like
MTISFNDIPANNRVPGIFIEIDNSRALAPGLIPNPHRALVIGQRRTVVEYAVTSFTVDTTGERSVTFDATNDWVDDAGTPRAVNDIVIFVDNEGVLPPELSYWTKYYVVEIDVSTNWFKISATMGGPAITFTDPGSGSHSYILPGTSYVDETGPKRVVDDKIIFKDKGGTLPTGLSYDTTYYVVTVGTDQFQVSGLQGGNPIDFADDDVSPNAYIIDANYGTALSDTLLRITRDYEADTLFGPGSQLARMINVFRTNNPNTWLDAIALDDDGAAIATVIDSDYTTVLTAAMLKTEIYQIMIDGQLISIRLEKGQTLAQILIAIRDKINTVLTIPVIATKTPTDDGLRFTAKNGGTNGNDIDIRNIAIPDSFATAPTFVQSALGASDPTIGSAIWDEINNIQYHHIIIPYIDATNLSAVEDELARRWLPDVDLKGHCYTAVKGSHTELVTLGTSRNSPHLSIIGAYDSPSSPCLWAAALGANAAKYLELDPGRPLHFLTLYGIVAPDIQFRFNLSELNEQLFSGISTYLVDLSENVQIGSLITTYQTDPSYLYVNTMFQLMEISFQIKTRIYTRFLVTRYKLVDDDFPVQAGTYLVSPRTIKTEIDSLAALLRDVGIIEDLEQFVSNSRVERDLSDPNRVNLLVAPDLVNQFRMLAGVIQFIL